VDLAVLLGSFGASALELAEAALVVLVVISRGQRRAALAGAVAAGVVVVAVAVALGPQVLGLVPVDRLRQLLGAGLLLLGCFWLLQAIVRPQATADELAHEAGSARRWAARGPLAAFLISAKAVGVEGAEAAVLTVAVGAPHDALRSAAVGAALAVVAVTLLAARLERRLTALAGQTLNRVAGTALGLVGAYWLAEGSHLAAVAGVAVFAVPVLVAAVAWQRWLGLPATAHATIDRT
jgi:uncharacterized membrane protein